MNKPTHPVGNRGRKSLRSRHAVEPLEQRVCLTSTFQPAVNLTVASHPDFAAVADLNRDGKPDLVTLSYASSAINVLLGNGDGTFQAATKIATPNASDFVTAGDLNGDGIPDLVIATYSRGTISVMIGHGDGTFGSPVAYSAGRDPRAVAIGDFNGDLIPDLAIAKTAEKRLTLLTGNGDGTFQAPRSYTLASVPTVVIIARVDGDATLDLVTLDYYAGKLYVQRGTGSGTFGGAIATSLGSVGPAALSAGDFNGDGKLDVATANFLTGNVSVLLGNGDGTFAAPVTYSTGAGATDIVAADFDGDGVVDLAVANGNADNVRVLFGDGDGTFTAGSTMAVGTSPRSLAIADFNGDGGQDIAVTNQDDATVSVLLANPLSGRPIANAGGPYRIVQGATGQLDASGSSGTGLTYAWDLDGDGIFGETGVAATRGDEIGATPTFSAAGLTGLKSTTVSVRVTSSGGLSSIASATLLVIETTPPQAVLSTPNAAAAGLTKYLFSVTYTDNMGIDLSTIDTSDVLVTGPNGFRARGYIAAISRTENGSPVVVTYRIAPPGGSWTWDDSGSYTVTLGANQVNDTSGNAVASGSLGTFAAAVAAPDAAGNTRATARNIGDMTVGRAVGYRDIVLPTDPEDYYRFRVVSSITLAVKLYGMRDNANLQLQSSTGTPLQTSSQAGISDEAITRVLGPGTYYVRVAFAGTRGTDYSLRLTASAPPPPDNAGNSIPAARALGTLLRGKTTTFSDYIGGSDGFDYYAFTLSQTLTLTATLSGLKANLDLQLLRGDGAVLQTSAQTAASNEVLTRKLGAGTYYLRVYPGTTGAASTYQLSVSSG